MASCHLIADSDLALLRNVHLGYLHYSVRKLVANLDLVHLALADCLLALEGDAIVVDELADEGVSLLLRGPFVGVDIGIVDALEKFRCNLLVLLENFDSVEVGDAGALLVLGEDDQLLDEVGVEPLGLALVICLTHIESGLLLCLGCASLAAFLGKLGVEGSLDDGTAEGRICLQGSILDITGLVAEDGLEKFLLRGRVALALRGDLTYHNVARLNSCADTYNTVLSQVLGGIFAHVRDVGSEFLHTSLGVAYFRKVLVYVNGGEYVPLDHLLGEHDGVLIVVALPRHERNLEVPSECELSVLGGVAFGKHLTCFNPFALSDNRLEGDGRALVGSAVDRKLVCGLLRGEAYEPLIFALVVLDTDLVGVDIGYFTGALRDHLGTRVDAGSFLKSGANDRGLRPQERNGLTHHVRAHQCTVGIVVLKERNAGSSH